MGDRTLDYIALGILIFVVLTIIYAIIYIHDIPYEMAKERKHPHQDAIHTAGWVSLILMHSIWPFLWIWASLYKPEVGWNLNNISTDNDSNKKEIEALNKRVVALEKKLLEKEA
ncbi:DUF3302 domain-containing protein [Sulfurimonas sp.]